MKKLIILALFLISCLSVGVFSGCGSENKGDNSAMLCGFDTYEEVAAVSWAHSFGKVELLKDDSEHKTQGDAYAKLSVLGSASTPLAKPLMTVYTTNANIAKTDFSDVKSFELDAYNDNDQDKEISLQIKVSQVDDSVLNYYDSADYPYVLKPHQQTHIVWEFDRSFLSKFINIRSVVSVTVKFENPCAEKFDIYYFDNFKTTLTDEKINDVIVREDREIESADRPEYLAAWKVTMARNAPCTLSYNSNPDYVKAGTGSIKIESPVMSRANYPTFEIRNTINTDFSDYDAISFWVYNDNEQDYAVTIFSVGIGTAKAKQWTRFEVSFAWLESLHKDGMTQENFSILRFTLTVPAKTSAVFYFDEIWAITEDMSVPAVVPFSYPNVSKNDVVDIIIPETYFGSVKSWYVCDSDNQVIMENETSYSFTENGIYTIGYRIANEMESTEYRTQIKVGYPIIEQTEYGRFETESFLYQVPVFSVSENSTLTWKVYNAANNQVVTNFAENAASYTISGGDYYIEYTAENEVGIEKCRVYLSSNSALLPLDEYYPELYSVKKVEGKPVVTDKKDEAIFGGKAIKLFGANGSKTDLLEGVLIGDNISADNSLAINVYNPQDYNVTLKFTGPKSNGGVTIGAKTRKTVYMPLTWFQSWGCLTENNGYYYINDFSVGVGGSDIIYIENICISKSSVQPKFSLKNYDKDPDIPENKIVQAPECTNSKWSLKVYDVTAGNKEIAVDGKGRFYDPAANHLYKFVYSVSNIYGDFSQEVQIVYNDARRSKIYNAPEYEMVAIGSGIKNYIEGKISDGFPAATNNGVITYSVYYYNNRTAILEYGGKYSTIGDLLTFSYDWSYAIDYTASNEYGSQTYRQWVFPCDAKMIAKTSTAQVSGKGELSDNNVHCGDDKSIKATTGTVTVSFDVQLQDYKAGNNRRVFGVIVTSNSESDIKITVKRTKDATVAFTRTVKSGETVNFVMGKINGAENFVNPDGTVSLTFQCANLGAEYYITCFYTSENTTVLSE